MTITYTKQTKDTYGWEEETVVETWAKAEHATIECDNLEELVEAGKWIGKHERTIAAYDIYEVASGRPYIEIWKK